MAVKWCFYHNLCISAADLIIILGNRSHHGKSPEFVTELH